MVGPSILQLMRPNQNAGSNSNNGYISWLDQCCTFIAFKVFSNSNYARFDNHDFPLYYFNSRKGRFCHLKNA